MQTVGRVDGSGPVPVPATKWQRARMNCVDATPRPGVDRSALDVARDFTNGLEEALYVQHGEMLVFPVLGLRPHRWCDDLRDAWLHAVLSTSAR